MTTADDGIKYSPHRLESTAKMTTQTPRTDAYEKEYLAWQEYAKQYGHLSEAMEQCPLEDDPIGMMRKFERELAAAQAKIDALMLEYCPEEMTKAQIENWAAHQKAAEGNDGPRT